MLWTHTISVVPEVLTQALAEGTEGLPTGTPASATRTCWTVLPVGSPLSSLQRGATGASFLGAIASQHREATTPPRVTFHARYNPGGSVRPDAIEETSAKGRCAHFKNDSSKARTWEPSFPSYRERGFAATLEDLTSVPGCSLPAVFLDTSEPRRPRPGTAAARGPPSQATLALPWDSAAEPAAAAPTHGARQATAPPAQRLLLQGAPHRRGRTCLKPVAGLHSRLSVSVSKVTP